MTMRRFVSTAALRLAAVMIPVTAAGAVTLSTTLSTDGTYVVSWSETLATGDQLSLCEKHNLRPWACQSVTAKTGSRPFTGKRTGVWQYKTAIDRVGGTRTESAVVTLEVHLPTDVGVIAGEAMCPDGNSPLWVFLDTYDGGTLGSGAGSSTLGGDWTGFTWLDGNRNVTLNFCRVDGGDFQPLIDSSTALTTTRDYAVLKLGSDCPAGSQSVGRFLDNQDKYCGTPIGPCYYPTSAIGPGMAPNWQDGNKNTWLYFCLFRRSADSTKMVPHVVGESPFPALGKPYGVFASQQFVYPDYMNLLHGWIFAEADSDNASSWDFSMLTGAAVENVITPTPKSTDVGSFSGGTLFNLSQAQDCFAGYCSSGACRAGFSDCDGDPYATGCETTLATDPNNCGACGAVCSSYNVSSTCVAGVCQPGTCSAGWADCNGNKQTDGCESPLATDPDHCGSCTTPCSTNHMATRACVGASCASGTCAAGYADCNGNKQTDGCETWIMGYDSNNCGACGRVCSSTSRCENGRCEFSSCPAGYKQCCDFATCRPLSYRCPICP